MNKKDKKFFYPYEPGVKAIYNKISFGRGSRIDFEELSRNFVLQGAPILQANEEYITDDNIVYLNKKKCYVARKSGYVYFNDNEIQILPYITFNDKKLTSFIIIPAQDFCKKPITETVISQDVLSFNFKAEITPELIKECFNGCLKLHRRSGGVKILHQGSKMVPDRKNDIQLDDRFGCDKENFTLLEGRRVISPKEIEFFHQVHKGEKIGTYMGVIPGWEGEDVFGKVIPRDQVTSFYQVGEGLKQTPDGEVIAAREGVFRINSGGRLTVRKTRIIDEELKTDLYLEDREDVIISGTIFPNVKIKLKGDLVIIGSVEKVHIDCQGDLFLTQGIINQCSINVGGDCYCQFISHSKVTTKGKVLVGQYTLDSEIKAEKDVLIRTNHFGEIVGGWVESENGDIETNSVGSISGTQTFLKVGKHVSNLDQVRENKFILKKYSNEKFLLIQNLNTIKPAVERLYKRWKDEPDSFSKLEETEFKNKVQKLKELKEKIQELEEKILEAEEQLIQSDPSRQKQSQIKIFEGVFEGVTVQINNIKKFFKHNMFKGFILMKNPNFPKIERHGLEDISKAEKV